MAKDKVFGLSLEKKEPKPRPGQRGHYVGGEVSATAALAFKILMRMYGITQKAAVDKAGYIIARDLLDVKSDSEVSLEALLKIADDDTREYFFNLYPALKK